MVFSVHGYELTTFILYIFLACIFNVNSIIAYRQTLTPTSSHTSALSKIIHDLQIHLNPKLEVRYSKEWGGKAYFATQDIESHETLVSIPFDKTIWYNSSNIQSTWEYLRQKGVLDLKMVQSESDISRSLLLALLICVDIHNKDSYYNSYYKLLPKSYPHYILNWKEEEVDELENTHAGGLANFYRTLLNGYYDTLMEKVPNFLYEINITREKYQWAFGAVASRCYDVSVDKNGYNGVIRAIIPVADFFNHHSHANVAHGYNSKTGRFHLVTYTSYRAGEQVFSNYGKRSSSILLIAYGYVPHDPTPYEYIRLELPFSLETEEYHIKRKILYSLGIKFFDIQSNTLHNNALFALRLIALKKEEISSKNIADLLIGKQLSISHERRTFQLLYKTCDKKLRMFKTSISYDKRVLEICQTYKYKFPCTQSENHLNAIRIRFIEKKLYNQWITFSNDRLNDLAMKE